MKEHRVAIVHPWPNFDAVPCLYGAAVLLSSHGYLVDIFTSVSPEFTTPIFDDERINLRLSRPDAFSATWPDAIIPFVHGYQD